VSASEALERAELLARRGLVLAVDQRPPVGALERLSQEAGQRVEVGGTQREAGPARGDAAVAGQHPHAGGEAVVVTRGLALAVLGGGELALGDFQAQIGVGQVGQAARGVAEQVAHVELDPVDQVDGDPLAHAHLTGVR